MKIHYSAVSVLFTFGGAENIKCFFYFYFQNSIPEHYRTGRIDPYSQHTITIVLVSWRLYVTALPICLPHSLPPPPTRL